MSVPLAVGLSVVLLTVGGAFAAEPDEPERADVAAEAGETAAPDAPAEETRPEEPAAPSGGSAGSLPPGVEVMRVRGRGVGAIAVDVPSSVTQFDSATIAALGAQDISDLSRVTPNVNIVQPGTQATFFVRGIGLSDFSSNAAGAVTIIQDDVSLDLPAIQTGQLFDIETVDIKRGPQGSGPYRNSSAGAISVRTRRPTGNYQAQLRASIGQYNTIGDKGARDGALIQDYEGAIEMPIIEGMLAARFAFRFRDAEPYASNGCGQSNVLPFDQRAVRIGNPDAPGVRQCGELTLGSLPMGQVSRIPDNLPDYVNDEHNWAARGTFGFQPPNTDWDVFLNVHGSRLHEDSTLGQAVGSLPLQPSTVFPTIPFGGPTAQGYIDRDVQQEWDAICAKPSRFGQCSNPFASQEITKLLTERPLDKKPYRGDYNLVGDTRRDAWGGYLSGEGEVFDDTNLFLLTSYEWYSRDRLTDSDFSPEPVIKNAAADEGWQSYTELRLEGELLRAPVLWSVGAWYLRESVESFQQIDLIFNLDPVTGEFDEPLIRDYTQGTDSVAVWGDFGWEFADDFTLEGGVRVNWDRKTLDFFKDSDAPSDPRTAEEEASWLQPTGQIILTYHIDENSSAYARYTHGYKVGHFNAFATNEKPSGPLILEPADPEFNDAWEAGMRGNWFDQRLEVAASYFYYRYHNYQIFLFTDSASPADPPVLEIVNAQEAENYGIEIEGVVRPLEGWAPHFLSNLRISANFGWLHGEFIELVTEKKFVQNNGDPFLVPFSFRGQQLPNAPKYKVSGTVDWTFDLGRFGYLNPRYDFNWSDDVFFDPNEGHGSPRIDTAPSQGLPDYAIGQKAFWLHNIRLAYRTPSSRIEIAGWIRNLTDQVYRGFAFDASQFTQLTLQFPGEPRTMGVDLSVTF